MNFKSTIVNKKPIDWKHTIVLEELNVDPKALEMHKERINTVFAKQTEEQRSQQLHNIIVRENLFNKAMTYLADFYEIDVNEEDIKDKIKVEESSPKDYLDKLLLVFDGQRVIINCYKGNKSYVQGKQSLLFQKIISLAIEKLPTDNAVIEVLNTYHALTVEKPEVENAFSTLLPNFPIDDKDTKLRNTLLSAVFNTLITGYMPDYTCLVTPLFRAMEFYLHRILSDRLGQDTTTLKGKNNFGYFKPNELTNRYEYNSSKGNLNNNQIDYLNDLYNMYKKMRHPYSHWSENSMDTQVITDIKTAHELILEGLQFINKYYIIF